MAHRQDSNVEKFTKTLAACKHARLPFERDWWMNTAFHLGEQYTEWYSPIQNIRRIPRDPASPNAPRPVVNKINHFVNQQHAFALQNKPVPDVIPTNDDLIAQSDAGVALAYCQWAASEASYEAVEEKATLWALVAGTGFKKWTWNTVEKRPQVEALTPFDLYLDPYADTWEKVRYVIHSRFMDPEQVYDQWEVEVQQRADKTDETRIALLREMGAAPVVEGVTVNEIWMKPTRRHPDGLYAVWVGQQMVVQPVQLPYQDLIEHRRIPFTIQGVIPRPGTPYYDSHVKYLRSPQMELNKYHAQIIMMRENFANLKWWAPEEIDLKTPITQHPAQVLVGSGSQGLKPEIIAPPSLPDTKDGEWITDEMMHVAGLHEVSQAQVPGRVESAKAIEMLKEADATRLSVLSSTTARSIEEGFWHFVALAIQFEEEKKMVSIYSDDGVAEVKAFKKRDVDPGIRFRVTMGTGLGYSRAGRTENLYHLWDRGLLQDDPARMLALLDIGGTLPLSSTARDVKLARNENYEMAQAIAVKPNSWDNHDIHIREHDDFRKSVQYRLLPPRAQAVFEFHQQFHKSLRLQTLQEEATLAGAAQGLLAPDPAAQGPQADQGPAAQGGAPGSSAGGAPTGPAETDAEPSPEPV